MIRLRHPRKCLYIFCEFVASWGCNIEPINNSDIKKCFIILLYSNVFTFLGVPCIFVHGITLYSTQLHKYVSVGNTYSLNVTALKIVTKTDPKKEDFWSSMKNKHLWFQTEYSETSVSLEPSAAIAKLPWIFLVHCG